jgi:methionyl aminopeptidase
LAKRPPVYKTPQERDGLRTASRFNAELMDYLRPFVKPGISTEELDKLAHEYTLSHGHTPACLGYKGYPKSICTSINEVVCHGIPGKMLLKEGDIVNLDLTTIVDGWYGDQSETFIIGKIPEQTLKLVQVTFDSLYLGIRTLKPNSSVFEIGKVIFDHASKFGYSVVRDYQGHGIGKQFHQEPGVPHFPHPSSQNDILKPGVCFTIEPMLNLGGYETSLDRADGWTVRTRDRMLSAQFEHTILMTEEGPEILTLTQNGPQEGHQF